MSVKTGRYRVYRDSQEVDATGSWSLGPGVSGGQVAGADATLTWLDGPSIIAQDTDWTDADYDGDPVQVWWEDEDGTTLVYSGHVDSTSGETGEDPTSRVTDGILRLTRSLDLRPMAYTLPVHPVNAQAGGRVRHVGLHGVWMTAQAMTVGGFDPGAPMHWSSVWHQSMCGSVATVPDKDHAYASLGDLRTAYRLSDFDLAPVFLQGDYAWVAADVNTFGVTTPPKVSTSGENTASLGWQVTVDMGKQSIDPTYGSAGEVLLRHLDTSAGVVMEWTSTQMLVRRHASGGTRTTLGTYNRTTGGIRDERWSIAWQTNGSITVRAARYEAGVWTSRTVATISSSGVSLPTGPDSLCTVRVQSPGVIGTVNVSRGNRAYMTSDEPMGRIYRHSLSAKSMPMWPHMGDVEAGAVLTQQAAAEVGMRGLGLLMWIDAHGRLVNTDFETLAGRSVPNDGHHVFDVDPSANTLALDGLAYQTEPGTAWSAVEVSYTRTSVARRPRPTLLLAEGDRQTLHDGDTYESWLHPERGQTWFEVDLRPLMAGHPYPPAQYNPRWRNALNNSEKSHVGGHRHEEESGDRRGWITPGQMGWSVNSAGHVEGAMRMVDPETIIVEGTANLPQGPPVQLGSTMPDPGSQGLHEWRKSQPLPQVRGYGKGVEHPDVVRTDIDGPDSRHGPYRHSAGLWVQTRTGAARIASNLHDAITNPTPTRTYRVEATGWVKVGDKIRLIERRAGGAVIVEEAVVLRISSATVPGGDAIDIEGVITKRTTTSGEDEWDTPPPDIEPDDPPSETPPHEDDDPPPGETPPSQPPLKPRHPELTYDPLRGFVVAWDGSADAGGSAIDEHFSHVEVALAPDAHISPTPLGHMWSTGPSAFGFVHAEPDLTVGVTWYARVRVWDRWDEPSVWSDVASAVVTPLIPWEDIEDLVDSVVGEEVGLLGGKVTISPDAPTPADGVGKPDLALWTQFDGNNLIGTWIWRQNPLTQDYSWEERDPQIQHIDLGTFGDLHGARLVAHTILTHHLAIGDFTNHLDNPRTDVIPGGAEASGWGVEPVAVTPHPTGGDGALQIVNSATLQFGGGNRWVPCTPGQQWYVAAQVRRTTTGAGAGGVTVGVETRDASGATTGLYGIASRTRTSLTNGTWVEIDGYGTAPAGTVEMRVTWWTDATWTSGTVQATAFEYRQVTDNILIADGAITAPKVAAQSIEAQHLTAAMALVSRLISPATPGLTTGPRTEMNPSGIQVYRSAEGDEDYVLTNLSSSGAQTIGVMNPAGEAVAGITEDGEVSGVTGGFQSVDVGGTDLLGTLPLAPDDITWDPVDETAGTQLGWLDLVPHSSPGSVEFPSITALFAPGDGEQPWFEFTGAFTAGRSYLIMADFRLAIGSGQQCDVRMRKTQVTLPSATGPTPPTTSSPTHGDVRTFLNGASASTANYGTFWTFNPNNSEEARFLVTLRNTGSTGEIAGSSARIAFVEVGHRSTQSLNAIDRRVATVPTPPASGAKKTYTSRWYATEVVNYQGAVVSPPGGGSHRAGQGRVGSMGSARRSYLRFDNATAHAGESGRTLSQALNGATIKGRRVRITNMRSVRSSVQAVIGQATSAGGTVTSLATSSAIPRGDQRTTSLGNGLTQAQMRAAGFRLVIGPGSSTADVSYAEFAGIGDGNGRRIMLEVTYER